jgi:multiple sugar transport system ATP-binding protein
VSVNVQKLRKQYGRHVAVNDVDIDILDGEFFVMLGPSGCGKTTTLRMIAGLDVPSAGRVWIRGRDVTGMEPRHRDIAMAFQDFGLYPNMTVFQNVQFPLKVRKMPEAERKRRVEDVAGRLGIDMLLDRKPGQISGGQRQRVSLARALVRSPHVFLMDEPLSNLDAKLRATMRKEIKQLVSNLGITTIYVSPGFGPIHQTALCS